MQDILPSYKAQNFSDLALLAMQGYCSAFQNTLLRLYGKEAEKKRRWFAHFSLRLNVGQVNMPLLLR